MNELIGYAAAFLTTFAFVPQVWQTLKTRNTQGISLPMYCLFASGTTLWLIYGLLNGLVPVVIANVVTTALAVCVLWVKWRNGENG